MRWNWWRKWPFWLLTQRSNLQRADCLHATSELEYEDIRNLGFRAPVMFLPNGVRIPQLTQPKTATERRRLLYLGRVHPTKGIDRVLRSWARLQQQHVDWELRIVGPDIAGHTAELRTLAAELGLQRTTFVGTVSEEQKTIEYRSAELFVLATHHDNWAVTVAEALAHELPVVVSKAAPWSGVETHDCGWWVDGDVDSLSETLQAALERQPEQLLAMGHRGRNWLRDAFAWPVVAQQPLEVYRWLVHGGTAPNSVRFD